MIILTTVPLLSLMFVAPPTPASTRLTPAELRAIVKEVSGDVERLRGLKFKTPVAMEVIEPRAARESFASEIDAATVDAARHTQNAYIHLRLTPRGTDLVRNYLDQAETDVLGYFHRGTKKLYLMSTVPADEVRGVVAHELTHALEDQHFDFTAVSGQARSDDHAIAIKAVIEGSATFVHLTYLHQRRDRWAVERNSRDNQQRAKKLKGAPSYVQQTVMLPYLLGFTFMLKGRPWDFGDPILKSDLDGAYTDPPRSTRHILHPEQYWGGRHRALAPRPTFPDLAPVLGPGWSRVAEGSVGELGLAVMAGSRLDPTTAYALLPQNWTNEAASGTRGDVYHHYVNGDRRVTVLLAQFESLRDAEQFTTALRTRGFDLVPLGMNVLVIAGDAGDKVMPMAQAALQGAQYWPGR